MENIIVIVIVITAVWFIVRTFKKESIDGGCKCCHDRQSCKNGKLKENNNAQEKGKN